jgi:protein ImuB
VTEAGAWPADAPLVLTDSVKGARRLAAVSRRALKLGLSPGLTLADARAAIPHLVARDHDPAADAALIERMGDDCLRWTPLVALDPPHGLMLDITGCAHLFGGEAALRERVLGRLRRGRFTVRGSIAGTPDAARALARFGQTALFAPGDEPQAVRPLSIAALELPDETTTALRRAGFKRVGDLADRPSAPLTGRFGPELTTRLIRLLGREDRRITPARPVPALVVEQPFAEPIGHADTIARVLRSLIGRACAHLEERGQGGRAFEASFFRSDGVVRSLAVETGRPVRDVDTIARLFREKIDSLADPVDPGFGFDLMRLALPVTEPLDSLQPDLDGKAVEADEVADLIDRLIARFGAVRVLRFAAADTHDPVRAARLVPATSRQPESAAWIGPEPGEPPPRPLHLFEPPQAVEALAEVPDGPPIRFRWRGELHDVARAEGPERLLTEWWRGHDGPARDYYRIEDGQGRRFWLFREGFYGGGANPRWYLHGLFA